MKFHLSWLRATAAATIAVAGVGGHPTAAQVATNATQSTNPVYSYPSTGFQAVPTTGIVAPPRHVALAPSTVAPPTYVAAQPTHRPVAAQPSYLPTTAPTNPTPVAQAPSYQPSQSYFPAQGSYAPYRPQVPATYGASSTYPTSNRATGFPTYVAMGNDEPSDDNQTESDNGNAAQNENTLPQPAQTNGAPVPSSEGISGYPGVTYGGAAGYEGADCATGYQARSYGISQYIDNPCYDSQWFGGVYFLYMERDDPGYTRFTSQIDTGSAPTPYFPQAYDTALSSDCVDFDYAPGAEVRFGATFSVGDSFGPGYGGCGYGGYGCGANSCGSCAPVDHYAWEVAWWGLDEDDQCAMVRNYFPDGPVRLYAMRTHAGLSYDGPNGVLPVDDYYDYQMPIENLAPDDIRVVYQRVRTYFSAQNLELNFLRFPVCAIGCGTSNACGAGGYDACGECQPCACGPASCFSITGVCGVRYFRTDDDFEWSNQWGTLNGGSFSLANDELFHEIQVDNNLVGFQLGSSMNYAVGSRWNFFLDSTFGLFNNHIRHYQRVYGANGNYAFFDATGEGMSVHSTKDDVAMLGELRVGGAYNISCNWRAVLAYRAVGMTGVALSTDQLRDEYSSWANTARIDSDGSMIIHGLQVGAECKY